MLVRSLGWEDPRGEGMASLCSILAWSTLWSLVGYSPWGFKELDTTEVTWHICALCLGESWVESGHIQAQLTSVLQSGKVTLT